MSLNLGSTSQMVFVNVNEFGSNGTPRLDVKLPRRKINLGVNDTQSVSIQLNIPRYYPNLPSQKLISLEVQPKGNTLSGKKGRLKNARFFKNSRSFILQYLFQEIQRQKIQTSK